MPKGKMFDIIYARPYTSQGERKVHWIPCGRGFETDKGFDLLLYTVPVGGTEGEGVRLMMRESDPNFQRGGQQRGGAPQGGGQRGPQIEQRRAPPRQEQAPAYDGPPPGDDDLPF